MSTHDFRPPADDADTTDTFLFAPNYVNDVSYLMLGISGTVNLTYEPGTPAPSTAYILSRGGDKQTLQPNTTNDYNVNDGDYIVIVGPCASCKVQFNYL